MPKASSYASLAAASVAAGDKFFITDVSVPANKNVVASDIIQAGLLVSTGFAVLGAANVLSFGPNGATNPTLQVDGATASAATGLKVTGAAAASGVAAVVISSGTNENLTINAKGSGTTSLNATATGNVIIGQNLQLASAKSIVDANGNEILKTAATVASAVNELTLTNSATGNPFLVAATGGDTNIGISVDAKGSGVITLNGTGTGNVTSPRGIVSTGPTAGIGYATGAGGAVTQGTSRTTGVTLNTVVGAITLVSAAGSTTPASFTVTNSAVAATDVVVMCQKSGTDLYDISVSAVGAGSFQVTFNTKSGTTTEQPVFNFAVIKGVAA